MKSPRSRTVLQHVPDQRIGPPQCLEEPARLAGVARRIVTSTKSLPPAAYIGAGVVSSQKESPSGFIGSVIIC